MLSERIFFIIERISDILKIDKERKEILTLCKELSDDERKSFLDLYSMIKEILKIYLDDKIREILVLYSNDVVRKMLKMHSDDKIRETLEMCSDDETKKTLEMCSDDEIHKISKMISIQVRHIFLKLYLPDDRTQQFLEMYRELSDDEKEEFLNEHIYTLRKHIRKNLKFRDKYIYRECTLKYLGFLDKYIYTLRKSILKYLEFRQMWFQKYSAGTFFKIITFLMGPDEGKDVFLSFDMRKGIGELQKELLRIYNYLKDVEEKYDDRQVLSEYEQQFYLNLSYLAHSCDDILDRVTSNDVVARDIDTLLETIHNSYRILRSEPNTHARSLMFFNYLGFIDNPLNWFVKFRLLRVLILHNIGGIDTLEEIGNLIHLRYIALRGLSELPQSIVNLENLWTLDIRYLICHDWNKTALNTLYKLKELRHLYFPDRKHIWGKIAVRKTKLKTLWNVAGGEWMLSGMSELSVVLQELCMHAINSKEQLEAVFRTPSMTSNTLHTLELHWSSSRPGSIPVELCDMSILGKCKSLKKLKLYGQIGVDTPIELPPNLMELEMMETLLCEREVMNIISKSCPQLKIFTFGADAYCGTELVCNANSFPQLEKLRLLSLKHLKLLIIEESGMPKLHHLVILLCKNLDFNPQVWERISKIPQLVVDKKMRPSPAWPTQVMVSTGSSGSLPSNGNTHSSGSTSNGNGKRAC